MADSPLCNRVGRRTLCRPRCPRMSSSAAVSLEQTRLQAWNVQQRGRNLALEGFGPHFSLTGSGLHPDPDLDYSDRSLLGLKSGPFTIRLLLGANTEFAGWRPSSFRLILTIAGGCIAEIYTMMLELQASLLVPDYSRM